MQNKKLLLTFILGIFLFSLVSASSLGTVKQNDCITLYQSCPSCSYVNITAIQYPNKTTILNEISMTKSGTEYTSEFCNTSEVGEYFYTTIGDKNGVISTETISFSITPNGKEFTVSTAISFSILILLILVLLILCISKLFSAYSPVWIITFSTVLYFLILILLFVLWIFCDNYLYSLVWICSLFEILFIICLILMFPFIIFLVIYLLYGMFNRKRMTELVGMGYSPEEAKKFAKR